MGLDDCAMSLILAQQNEVLFIYHIKWFTISLIYDDSSHGLFLWEINLYESTLFIQGIYFLFLFHHAQTYIHYISKVLRQAYGVSWVSIDYLYFCIALVETIVGEPKVVLSGIELKSLCSLFDVKDGGGVGQLVVLIVDFIEDVDFVVIVYNQKGLVF